MKSYYKQRAPIYDRVYGYPERQADLRFLEEYVARFFAHRNVLEIAAGTGYWTQFIAPRARSMLVTDALPEPLAQARQRPNVENAAFAVADAYTLEGIGGRFDGLFAGLWLSHMPREKRDRFLDGAHRRLTPGARVLFLDNSRAQCARLPISERDAAGNTYQERLLDDGTRHRVLKNFPAEEELMALTAQRGAQHRYLELKNFWVFHYIVAD